MNTNEAMEWIQGTRSMTNIIPQDPRDTWMVRIAEADAAMMQQAYWSLKAWNENLVNLKHVHVNNGIGDGCKQCGRDLRDEVHVRL